MKQINKIYKIFSIVLLSGIIFLSCTKDFEEMNTNPNRLTDVPETNTLAFSILQLTDISQNQTGFAISAAWAQIQARILYPEHDIYKYRDIDMDNTWRDFYEVAKNLNFLIEKATDPDNPNPNLEAVSRILKAYTFQQITDLWGDIPYSEALQADGENQIFSPAYDSQESIYMDLINELQTANTLLNGTRSGEIGSGDFIYQGNLDSWQKFCNSLLLRMYIHASKISPTMAQNGIETIFDDPANFPIFSSNDDDAQMEYYDSPDQRNPLVEDYLANTVIDVPSERFIDFLVDRTDPRLDVFVTRAANDNQYRGQPNGDDMLAQADLSLIADEYVRTPTAPLYLLTYSEVLFIKAEAAQNGWDVGSTAEDAYNAAISASMDKHGATIGTYLSDPLVDFNAVADKAKVIGEQKWVALFMQGNEAFTEHRRTGYPEGITEVPLSGFPGRGVPVRYAYPTSEFSSNFANFQLASTDILDNIFGKKLWWDVN